MKKPLTSIIILLTFASVLWNCKQEKVISETEFEQAVFYEMFPVIFDAVYFDIRLVPPPPPPPEFLEKRGYSMVNGYKEAYRDWEVSVEGKNRISAWEKRKDSILQDPALIYLSISDSVRRYEREDMYKLVKHFKNQNVVIDSVSIQNNRGFKVELEKLKTSNKKQKFMYRSELPKGTKLWRTEYDFYLAVDIGFDQILFDKTKTYGVLSGGYTKAPLSGSGFRVFIKKDSSGKWVIDEVVGTWIS